MSFSRQFEKMLPQVLETMRRFPVPILASLLLCCKSLLEERTNVFLFKFDAFDAACCSAFLAGGFGHLYAQTTGRSRVIELLLAASLASLAAALLFFKQAFSTSNLFFFGGMMLALMLAPFLRRNAHQGAFWLFNLRLFTAAMLAIVIGLVFGLGATAVLSGLNFLFALHFYGDTHSNIWNIAVGFVGPVYGLSLVPANFIDEIDMASHRGTLMERGVSILVNYVMVPLALIYALILHVYAAKVAFSAALPKGEIGMIVSLFAVGGTVTWLVGWPWRETGTRLLRLFMRAWFWLLPVPVSLLVLAIWRRLADYGVTPDRYGIALVAVWAGLVFLYLALRRNRADMRVILGAAAALFLAGSFGPFGAFRTSASSQLARLETLLVKAGVLSDGHIVTKLPILKNDVQEEGWQIVRAIGKVNGLADLKPWFANSTTFPEITAENDWEAAATVSKNLGLYTPYAASRDSFYLDARLPADYTTQGKSRILGPFSAAKSWYLATGKSLDSQLSGEGLSIYIDGHNSTIATSKIIDAIKAQLALPLAEANGVLKMEATPTLTLLIFTAQGSFGNNPTLDVLNFWVIQHG
jgi:Domain of unknown function (DUF4153)